MSALQNGSYSTPWFSRTQFKPVHLYDMIRHAIEDPQFPHSILNANRTLELLKVTMHSSKQISLVRKLLYLWLHYSDNQTS